VLYVDADHGGDRRSRYSTTGWIAFLSGRKGTWIVIGCGAKRQGAIATSTTDAEIAAFLFGGVKGLGMLPSLEWLLVKAFATGADAMYVLCDSQPALQALAKECFSARLRHLPKTQGVHLAFVRSELFLKYHCCKVLTTDNLADLFTKPLDYETFCWIRNAIGLIPFACLVAMYNR
jgi:hypothetical protein